MVSHDRHLLDACVDGDRRARPRADPHLAGRLLAPTPSRASSSSSASSSLRHAAEGDRAPGGGGPALPPLGAHHASTSARPSRRASSRCRSTAWRRSTGRCSSGARWRSRCAAARAAASACSRSRASTSRYGDDPVLLDVELVVTRGERVGVVGPNGGGKTDAAARCSASELEPAAGTRWVGRRDRRSATSPRPPAGAAARRDRDRRAARRPLAGRGRRRCGC